MSSGSVAPVARVREFDEQALLDCAQELFWSRGFDDISVNDVTLASGVSNGSIYAAYGTKLALFLTVFERYCARRAEHVDDVLAAAAGSERDAVRAYFEAIIADCAAQPGRRGCLMINSTAQLGHRVPQVITIASGSTQRMEASVAQRIGGRRGDFARLSPAEITLLSAHIVMVSQGFIQLSRLGTTRKRLRQLADLSCASLPV